MMDNLTAPHFKATLKLDEKLTIHHLAKYHQEQMNLLQMQALQIDASAVREIDTPALQLVAYYVLFIKEHQGTIHWSPAPSSYFLDQVAQSGLKNVII